MNRPYLVASFVALGCSGCATSYYYQVRLADAVDPRAFELSLDEFLRTDGLRPFRELHADDPRLVADVTYGLPRWDKSFDFTWPRGAGFISVELDPPYNPIGVNVGGTDNRLKEVDWLAREVEDWVHHSYPNIQIRERKVRFTRFPW